MAETFEYVGPISASETFEPIEAPTQQNEPGYLGRVGERLAAIPSRLVEGVQAAPYLYSQPVESGLKVLGALGAFMEPVMAPAGEAGRAFGRYAGESFLKTGVLPGMEGFAPEPIDVSQITPEQAQTIREGAGTAYALGAELAVGFGRPVANLAASIGAGIRGPLSKAVTPIGQKMIDVLGYKNIRLAQVTSTSFMDWVDGIAGGSILGKGIYARHGRKVEKVTEQIADDYAALLGVHIKDPQARGNFLSQIIKNEDTAWRDAGNKLFKQVDQLHPEPAVDMSSVHTLVKQLQAEFPEGTEAGNLLRTIGAQIAPAVKQPAVDPIMSILTGQAPGITSVIPAKKTFLGANDLRSWAYSWKTPGLSPAGDQAARVGTMVGGAVDEAIDTAGRLVSPSARTQLQVARDFWRGESADFNRRAVRRILHDGNLPPEKVIDTFVKPGALTEIQGFRKMAGGPDSQAWGTVRRSFVEDMIAKSIRTDIKAGKEGLNATALASELRRWGPETTKEVLGEPHASLLKDLVHNGNSSS